MANHLAIKEKTLMKTMVLYDSQFGNTAQIARAIADGLDSVPGDDEPVGLRRISEANPDQLGGLDLLIVGSPTQKFRPTMPTTNFLKSIPKNGLKGVKVAAFDTRITEEEIQEHGFLAKMVNIFGYAADPISDRLGKKGGAAVMPPEGFTVTGTEGPLAEGELERAAAWARQILAKV